MKKINEGDLTERKKIKNFLISIPLFYIGLWIIYATLDWLMYQGIFSIETTKTISTIISAPFLSLAALLPVIVIVLFALIKFEKILDAIVQRKQQKR